MNKREGEKSKITLMLFIAVVAFALVAVFLTASRNGSGDLFGLSLSSGKKVNQTKVKGAATGSGDVDVCSVLGMETADVKSYVSDGSKYYDVDLGVLDTDACPGNSVDEIVNGILDSRASNIHVVRLGMSTDNCVFDSDGNFSNTDNPADVDEIVQKINDIRTRTKGLSGPKVHIMPVIEPRSDWSRKFGDDCNGDGACTAATNGGTYLKNIVAGLKNGTNSDVQNYLIFPAFNYHVPDGDGVKKYNDGFINAYGADNFKKDFVSYGVSLQREVGGPISARTPMADRISQFRSYLEGFGLKDYKLSFFSANVVNTTADQAFVEDLLSAARTHIDVLDGIYITTPWGWSGAESQVKNNEIPLDIWHSIFSECSKSGGDISCKLSPVADLPGIKNCNVPKDSSVTGNLKIQKDSSGKYNAMPVVTQKATMTLVNWLGDVNYLQKVYDTEFDGPAYGTSVNPYMAPCARDKQINPEYLGSTAIDLSKQFTGPVRFFRSSSETDYIDYQMPLLGNALACMIWSGEYNVWDGTSMSKLEPRFVLKKGETLNQTTAGFEEESINILGLNPSTFAQWIARLTSQISSSKSECSGEVTRVEPTDSYKGPEMIISNEVKTFDAKAFSDGVKSGTISYANGIPYYLYGWPKIESAEIPGAGKAMAQIWLDESIKNPWGSRYKVIHRDQAGVKVTLEQRMYDGFSPTADSNYSSPLSTDSECKYTKFETSSGKSLAQTKTNKSAPTPLAKTDFIFPWIGQTLKANIRMTKVYSNVKTIDGQNIASSKGTSTTVNNYGDVMHKKITDFMDEKKSTRSSEFYGRVMIQILNPTYIFTCSDLEDLKSNILDGKKSTKDKSLQTVADGVVKVINETDCLGKLEDTDPMQEWLCSKDLLPTAFCQSQCYGTAKTKSDGFIWPVKGSITQGYRLIEGDSSISKIAIHPGIDVGIQIGTDVAAAADGEVIYYNFGPGKTAGDGHGLFADSGVMTNVDPSKTSDMNYGGIVVIQHNDFYTVYAHLSAASTKLKLGAVSQGDIIAQSGNTGYSSGPHLHFEIRRIDCFSYDDPDCTVDPLLYLTDTEQTIDTATDNGLDTLPDKSLQCTLPDGSIGTRVDPNKYPSKNGEGFDWNFLYQPAKSSDLSSEIKNMCGIKMVSIPEEEMIQIVQNIGQFNDQLLKKDYNSRNLTRAEMVHAIYEASKTSKSNMPPELAVAIWLSENGMNPKLRSDYLPDRSDVFGCAVNRTDCPMDSSEKPTSRGLNSFKYELACTTYQGTTSPCQVTTKFNASDPGEYFEMYGPVEDSNSFFANKMMLILSAFAMRSTGLDEKAVRIDDGQCNMYVNLVPDSVADELFVIDEFIAKNSGTKYLH